MYIVGFDAKSAMHKAITVGPSMTILDARDTMIKYNISRVVVAKDNKAVGILTEKDIARFLYLEAPSRRLNEIEVSEIMTKNLVTVHTELDERSCAKLMLEREISSLLVEDNRGNLKGILTKTDLVDGFIRYFAGEHLVSEFMTKKVLTVAPEEPIHMAIMLMIGNKVSRVIVINEKRPIGVITTRDLLPISVLFGTGVLNSYWTTRKDLVEERKKQRFIPSGIKEIFIASDVMTRNPIVINDNLDLADAGYIMLRNLISGLPVVDSKSLLNGIVTKTDIVKALASHA